MAALESASVDQDITPFARFLGGLISDRIEGKPGIKGQSLNSEFV
jgi:nitrate/nitrite transporter NarK